MLVRPSRRSHCFFVSLLRRASPKSRSNIIMYARLKEEEEKKKTKHFPLVIECCIVIFIFFFFFADSKSPVGIKYVHVDGDVRSVRAYIIYYHKTRVRTYVFCMRRPVSRKSHANNTRNVILCSLNIRGRQFQNPFSDIYFNNMRSLYTVPSTYNTYEIY